MDIYEFRICRERTNILKWLPGVRYCPRSLTTLIHVHVGCMLSRFRRVRLCDSTDHSLPGSSVHWDSPGKNTEVGCHALLQGIFLTQGSNPHLLCLLHWQVGFLSLAPAGKPRTQEVRSQILHWIEQQNSKWNKSEDILTHTHMHLL